MLSGVYSSCQSVSFFVTEACLCKQCTIRAVARVQLSDTCECTRTARQPTWMHAHNAIFLVQCVYVLRCIQGLLYQLKVEPVRNHWTHIDCVISVLSGPSFAHTLSLRYLPYLCCADTRRILDCGEQLREAVHRGKDHFA